MAVKIFHYPNCSTCKRALAWLRDHDVAFEAIDIVASPPSAARLRAAAKLGEIPLRKLFNTAGQSYRAGGFKDRLPTMSDAEAFAALAADGKLIKRPLLVTDDTALVGFRPDEYVQRLR
jgi:arsenate reductase